MLLIMTLLNMLQEISDVPALFYISNGFSSEEKVYNKQIINTVT